MNQFEVNTGALMQSSAELNRCSNEITRVFMELSTIRHQLREISAVDGARWAIIKAESRLLDTRSSLNKMSNVLEEAANIYQRTEKRVGDRATFKKNSSINKTPGFTSYINPIDRFIIRDFVPGRFGFFYPYRPMPLMRIRRLAEIRRQRQILQYIRMLLR